MSDPRIPETERKEEQLPDALDQVDPARETGREGAEADIERP